MLYAHVPRPDTSILAITILDFGSSIIIKWACSLPSNAIQKTFIQYGRHTTQNLCSIDSIRPHPPIVHSLVFLAQRDTELLMGMS